MKNQKRLPGFLTVTVIWALLAVTAWVQPAKELSESERRPLKQFPDASVEEVLDGSFMKDFDAFSLDQFPLRDRFRQIKSVFHTYVLGQKDNNGIYIVDGYAAKQEYPLNVESLDHARKRFENVYQTYLESTGSRVYLGIVPDKSYYLAERGGNLRMDYEQLFRYFREAMPWARYVDLTDTLSLEDYYRTDTHWRQEQLLDTAERLCQAMGVTSPRMEDYRITALERPFYGVYYGQAALPMEPDTLHILESDLLSRCTVYDYESGTYKPVYDLEKLWGRDPYDVFLSGSRSLLTIENPDAPGDKELIVFRDSFGSSLVPLLLNDYSRVTLVDIRYIQAGMLGRYLEFKDQDILFLYSTLVLNNSATIK